MSRSKVVPAVLLSAILLFAFYIRSNTFWLPHWQGDQSQYISLAMKWEKLGLNGYNLREIKLNPTYVTGEEDLEIIYPSYIPGEEGDVLKGLRMFGFGYYDTPVYLKAPFFPMILTASHQLFTQRGHPYLAVESNLGTDVKKRKPEILFKAQFWAVIVPLVASLLNILLSFFMGKKLFNTNTGLFAAFLMAIHPIAILTSNRVLSDEVTTLFIMLALFIFIIAHERKSYLGAFVAGVACGLATLTRQNAILIIISVWSYTILLHPSPLRQVRQWGSIFFNPLFLFYVVGTFFICGEWFYLIYQTFGSPIYEFDWDEMRQFDETGWFSLVENRPIPLILYTIGIPYLCPLFIMAYFSVKPLLREIKEVFAKQIKNAPLLYLWLWVLPVFIYFLSRTEREHRYLLMVYPALAILAGCMIEQCRRAIAKYFEVPAYGYAILWSTILLTTFWSVPIGLDAIYNNRLLILKPF